MGPRSDERGEAEEVPALESNPVALQWGRALMSAESPGVGAPRTDRRSRFNGAAL